MVNRWVRWAVSACAVAAVMPCQPANAGLVSEREELQAGKQADEQIQHQYQLGHDEAQLTLVKKIGTKLVRVCERSKLTWTFRVLDSKEVNAFSVPSYVYVTTSLLKAVGNDRDALAGVIGHEIGHTTGRHAAKQMEKAAIGNILGTLIAGRNRNTGQLLNVVQNLAMLGYSRDDENDADRRGVHYTIAAGYDPEGMVRFFRKLEKLEGKQSSGLAVYFRTHPPTADRIVRVEKEIAKERGADSKNVDSSRRRDDRAPQDDRGEP